jgi:hypothetical protein
MAWVALGRIAPLQAIARLNALDDGWLRFQCVLCGGSWQIYPPGFRDDSIHDFSPGIKPDYSYWKEDHPHVDRSAHPSLGPVNEQQPFAGSYTASEGETAQTAEEAFTPACTYERLSACARFENVDPLSHINPGGK